MSRIRANTIVNGAGTGAPNFPRGAIISGISTINAEISVGTGTSISSPGTNELAVGTNNTERILINTVGDIGINKSSVVSFGSAIPTIEIKGRATSGGLTPRSGAICFESGSGTNGYAALWGHEGGIEYYSSPTDRDAVVYGFKFTSGGNIAFASGKGIDFSATSDGGTSVSELLDDYEEGSWVPTGTADLQGYSNPRYIKVGRLVTITVRLDFATNSSSTRADIGGLPFTPDQNISNSAMGSAVGETTYTGTDRPWAGIENAGLIRFRINGGTSMTYSDWSNKSVRLSLTYFSGT